MAYGDEVIRLRREVAELRALLGEKASENKDLFGEKEVGSKEHEQLQAEHAVLMRRLAAEEQRQEDRNETLRKVERIWDADAQARTAHPRMKPSPRDNRDLFVPEEEFRRTGGM